MRYAEVEIGEWSHNYRKKDDVNSHKISLERRAIVWDKKETMNFPFHFFLFGFIPIGANGRKVRD